MFQVSHIQSRLHGRPRETAQHRRPRFEAGLHIPSAREHRWHHAVRSVYKNAPLAVVHLVISLRSSRLVGDHLSHFGATDVAPACSSFQDRVFPSCPDFGSGPRAHAVRERRRRHIAYLLFECPRISGLGGSRRLPFSEMTSSGRVLDLIMQGQCCLLCFLPIVPLLSLPRLALSRSCSTLLMHWDITPLGA